MRPPSRIARSIDLQVLIPYNGVTVSIYSSSTDNRPYHCLSFQGGFGFKGQVHSSSIGRLKV
jgi:hypothetical protein